MRKHAIDFEPHGSLDMIRRLLKTVRGSKAKCLAVVRSRSRRCKIIYLGLSMVDLS